MTGRLVPALFAFALYCCSDSSREFDEQNGMGGGAGASDSGGSGNSATGGSGNTATGGSGNSATGGSGNSATGGSGNTAGTGAAGSGGVGGCTMQCAVGEPCVDDTSCAEGSCVDGVCRPPCSGSCAPGDGCAVDDDCGPALTCHSTDHVCLEVCSDVTIVSPADLADRRFCKEIVGNLTLEPSFTDITATDLPYLTSVSGDVQHASSGTLVNCTLSALQSVGGKITFGLVPNMDTLSFPELRIAGPANLTELGTPTLQIVSIVLREAQFPKLQRVNGTLSVSRSSYIERVDFRALTTVTGDFSLTALEVMNSANFSALQTIGGNLTLDGLCNLPYTVFSAVDTAGVVTGTRTVTNVGCCFFGLEHNCDGSCQGAGVCP